MTAGSRPTDTDTAIATQLRLREQVVVADSALNPRTAAGVDIAYDTASDLIWTAGVVLDVADLGVLTTATARGRADFPYRPGLLAFRELPTVLALLEALSIRPDVVLCDGHGLAHPRRFGLASHLGVLADIPTIGVAKNPPPFDCEEPGAGRGDWTDIRDSQGVVGRALRTQDGVKPVYVSVGHRIGLDEACDLVLRLAPRYRQPETTRQADQLGRRMLRG